MRVIGYLVGVAMLAVSTNALAVPRSPISIEEQLGLNYEPPCTICHTGGSVPNAGDVKSPFAVSMLANGLVPNDRPAMNAALAALEAQHIDSDGDGFTDIAELKLGLDPSQGGNVISVPATLDTDSEVSKKGCSASPGRAPSGASLLELAMVVVGLFAIRRRR